MIDRALAKYIHLILLRKIFLLPPFLHLFVIKKMYVFQIAPILRIYYDKNNR